MNSHSKSQAQAQAQAICIWRAESLPGIDGEVDQWDRYFSAVDALLDLLHLEALAPLVESGEVKAKILGHGSLTNRLGDLVQVPNKIMRRMADCGVDFLFDVYGRDDEDED